jgi:putative ABC transport system substrate-binding protein
MKFRARILVTIIPLLLFLSSAEHLFAARQIVLIYSDTTKQTLRTIAGFDWSLKEGQPDCATTQVFLSDGSDKQKGEVERLRPELLITVGSTATSFADRNFPNLPVVFAKVLNPIESGFIPSWDKPGKHLTGAALDIPPDQQMQRFVSMIPGLKKVGVIYTKSTERLVSEARVAATALGIELISYHLASAKELPTAIDSLCASVGGIWTVADEELSTPQFIRFTLLEALRHRIPVMGFNQTVVQSGALFCLEADYKYVGRQAAELAIAVLRGVEFAKVKPTVPDVFYLYLNLKTGKLLNIDLPAELVNIAKGTY